METMAIIRSIVPKVDRDVDLCLQFDHDFHLHVKDAIEFFAYHVLRWKLKQSMGKALE